MPFLSICVSQFTILDLGHADLIPILGTRQPLRQRGRQTLDQIPIHITVIKINQIKINQLQFLTYRSMDKLHVCHGHARDQMCFLRVATQTKENLSQCHTFSCHCPALRENHCIIKEQWCWPKLNCVVCRGESYYQRKSLKLKSRTSRFKKIPAPCVIIIITINLLNK